MLFSKVIIVSLIGAAFGGSAAGLLPTTYEACNSWTSLQRETQSLTGVQLHCDVNKFCTGLSCSGKYKEYRGKIEARLQHCSEPVSLEVYLSIPQLGIQNWNHTFFHGERVPLPPLKTAVDQTTNGNGFLEIYMQRQDEATVLLGVSIVQLGGEVGGEPPISLTLIRNQTVKMQVCVDGHDQVWPTAPNRDKPLLRAASNPVPVETPATKLEARQLKDKKSCNLDSLESCGVGEICHQSDGITGFCDCLHNYHSVDGVCQQDPVVPSPTSGNTTDKSTADASKSSPADSHLAVKVAVPVMMFVLLAALAGLSYKFRWVPRIRARFRRSNIYEEMVIEGDDITTMQTPVGNNPIA